MHKQQLEHRAAIRPDTETMNQTLRCYGTYETDFVHAKKGQVGGVFFFGLYLGSNFLVTSTSWLSSLKPTSGCCAPPSHRARRQMNTVLPLSKQSGTAVSASTSMLWQQWQRQMGCTASAAPVYKSKLRCSQHCQLKPPIRGAKLTTSRPAANTLDFKAGMLVSVSFLCFCLGFIVWQRLTA